MVRRAQRWDTKFGRFVGRYTVRRLADDLSQRLGRIANPITPNTVHEWIAGRATPRLEVAVAIERLSHGRVRGADICAHRERVGVCGGRRP